jgi:hypothetical protein
MLHARLFFTVLAAGLLAIQIVQQVMLSPRDPFAPDEEYRLQRLHRIYVPQQTAYKIRHLLHSPTYDLMALGNSSILGIQEKLVDEYGHFFNMAVPGSSLPTTAAIAELLDRHNRLPPTLLVMLENFDHFTQQVQLLPLQYRLQNAIDEISAGIKDPDISAYETFRMFGRLLKEEATLFVTYLNGRLLSEHLAIIFSDVLPAPTPPLRSEGLWIGYGRDGAGLGDMTGESPITVPILPRGSYAAVLDGYVANHLGRLAVLKANHRIVLYESPLEPSSMAYNAMHPNPRAEKLRHLFVEACERYNLECHAAPMLGVPGAPTLWTDAYHPPSYMLAPFVTSLLDRRPGQAKP